MRDREKALRDRQKLVEKREKNARAVREKQVKQGERARLKKERRDMLVEAKAEANVEREVDGRRGRGRGRVGSGSEKKMGDGDNGEVGVKSKKDRKFCMLPPKNNRGKRDPCWERVFMEGVDEVGAHCGLFVVGRLHYEGLVGGVGERIRGWVVDGEVGR